jgi:UDP-N-acetyl-D-galactosamine dehydrogenase
MNLKGVPVKDSRILILGYTFKENCPDTRNTKVVDIYHTLRDYTPDITVYDPWVAHSDIVTTTLPEGPYDAAILAVAHDCFRSLDLRALVPQPGVIYDVKGLLPREIIDARL